MIRVLSISIYLLSLIGWMQLHPAGGLYGETEQVPFELADEAPYKYIGRTFTGDFATPPHGEATATAVGPGVILTAAHVLWTNSPNTVQLPWENYRRWHPGVASQNDPSFTNVVSIVSLTGYANAIDVYDLNQYDGASPMEVFNRDAMVLLFSDDSATPYGFARAHPRAYQSGFLYDSNLYEVVGYPSAKYPQGDARGWKVHRTISKERQWLSERGEDQFEPGYRYRNRLFNGGRALDTEAGNSGGPLMGRGQEGEPWLISGVVVGQNSLFRVMDEELSDLIDTAMVSQVENNQSRFRFLEPELEAAEGAEQPVIQVERVGDLTNSASVNLSFADIQTTEEVDYHSPVTLEWEAGEGGAKTLEFEIVDDDKREGDETLVVMLEPDNGSALDAPHTAHLTIHDNDLTESLDEWEDLPAFKGSIVWKVVFGEGKFVGAGGRELSWWSHDFEETGFEEFPTFSFLDNLYYLNGKFIATGVDSRIVVSEDGVDWEVVSVDSFYGVVDVAYGNGKYVAVGGYTSPYNYLDDLGMAWFSPDGYQWSLIYDRSHLEFEGVAFGAGQFLAWTWEDLYRSSNGETWTLVDDQDGLPTFLDVDWGDDVFVAVDVSGGILTSADGVQWNPTEITEGLPLYSITYRNGYFVAAGRNGRIVTSDDGGQSWKERYPGIQETLVQGVAAAGKMIVAGDNRTLVADLGEYFEFLYEPEFMEVSAGELVELSAEFVSSSEDGMNLQWQKDGLAILGATEKTLVLESTYSVDAGEYRLVVTLDDQTWFSPTIHLSLDKQQQAPELTEAATQSSYGISLAWDDQSAHEEAYRVERRKQGSETWIELVNLAADSTRYTDRNLTPETAYQYRISAVAGEDVVSVVTDVIVTREATNLVNLSTRGLVGKGDDVMIGGFVIPEGPAMTLYIRGLGPSLQSSGISNTISDPFLRLVQTGVSEPLEVLNDDWVNSSDSQAIVDSGLPPPEDNESAMFVTLASGSYTAILSNEGEEALGVGLIEIYDITEGCETCRLTNLSTRGVVKGGNDLMIGGLVISGAAQKQILVRGLGPSLTQVEATLADPVLKMVNEAGDEFSIDDWGESDRAVQFAELGLPMDHQKEAAEIYQVSEGAYTFQVSGNDEGEGVALLEIFEVD